MNVPGNKAFLEQLIARDALKRLIDDVSCTGARVMPLKGVLLVALGLRKASQRPMIDVDVLVQPEHASEVVRAARARGWVATTGTANACVLIHPHASSTSIDLHRELFRAHLYRMPTADVFARGSDDSALFGRSVRLMSRLDIYAHLVGHFAKGRSARAQVKHLRDFAAVSDQSGRAPAEFAAHLRFVGMARAATYALGLASEVEKDGFAKEVVACLRPGRRDRSLVRAADAVLRRVEPGSWWGIPAMHALNSSLPRGVLSFYEHVTQSSGESADECRWWRDEHAEQVGPRAPRSDRVT